jgi:hypothetical protein
VLSADFHAFSDVCLQSDGKAERTQDFGTGRHMEIGRKPDFL